MPLHTAPRPPSRQSAGSRRRMEARLAASARRRRQAKPKSTGHPTPRPDNGRERSTCRPAVGTAVDYDSKAQSSPEFAMSPIAHPYVQTARTSQVPRRMYTLWGNSVSPCVSKNLPVCLSGLAWRAAATSLRRAARRRRSRLPRRRRPRASSAECRALRRAYSRTHGGTRGRNALR